MNVPESEIHKRWAFVKSELEANGKDALIVPLGVHFHYFFRKEGLPSERLIAGIIPKDEDPFIIAPAFEQSNIEINTGIEDVVIWEETESPYKILANELERRNIGNKLIADPKLWLIEVEKIQKTIGSKLTSAHEILSNLRSVKSEWELKQMQLASKYSAEGILAAIPQLTSGMSETQFRDIVVQEMSNRSGNPPSFAIIQFGRNSAIPHGMPSAKRLHDDEVVLIDAGTSVNGYHGDITITVPFGKPPEFENIYEIVFEANRRAFEADKEGMLPADVDAVARSYIIEKGYGKYFTHRLGHGLGLEVHEPPYIVSNNKKPLVTGNTHTIEPGIYLPGKFGVRIEDNVIVGKNRVKYIYEPTRHNW